MALGLLFNLFELYQKFFLARSLAFARPLNSRNVEAYWYIAWNHTLFALVSGVSLHLVAPQYLLWCVYDAPPEEAEPREAPGELDILAPDDETLEETGDEDEPPIVEEPWVEPPLAGVLTLDQNPVVLDSDESDDDGELAFDTSIDSTATVAQRNAPSQITDFAIVAVLPAAGTDTSETSALGQAFTALSRGIKLLSPLSKVLRSRRAELSIANQMPRILVEVKRYIHRNISPENSDIFDAEIQTHMIQAQRQLMRQAAVLFSMPDASAQVVILVAAVGPYYSTTAMRRKKNVRPEFIAEALRLKDMSSLWQTLVAPRWDKPVCLGTQASDKRLLKIRSRLNNWEKFEEKILA
ncbi:hypothetical protein C8R46DRAFT_594323 [Mycena filopes]|nr:hypothetical protein C8R46DRAFT_594323 [Mycena filopes]